MELLVAQEVDSQLQKVNSGLTQYLKREQVETYALNQLPAMYASSQVGLERQMQRARREYGAAISTAVRRGFVAVQQDPLKQFEPIEFVDEPTSQQALERLRHILNQHDITWDRLPEAVAHTLKAFAVNHANGVSPAAFEGHPGDRDYQGKSASESQRASERRKARPQGAPESSHSPDPGAGSESANVQPQKRRRVVYDRVTGRPRAL
ncbi:MAG: late competence development ComFB family protein [Cyanobacteria bacterium P01_H01_bin.121]